MKVNKKVFLATSILGGVMLVGYIFWRTFFTLPKPSEYGWLATCAGVLLLLAEGRSVFEALLSYIDLNREFQPEMPEIPEDMYPDVDVFIATHNEEEDLLFKTANACRRMKYPDREKVHVWICDDTNRPAIRKLADRLGVGYIGLSGNKDAKAGNLNNALGRTCAPLIATFDADMIPNSEFLLETVPYFFLPKMKKDENGKWVKKSEDEIDPDDKIGFIQTPQSFYNPDLFQYNLYSTENIPNEQDYFFRQVNLGKNRTNSPIYAGSNTVISREALEEVGGIATGTITEDFETGLLIESSGYKCYAVDKLLAKGLSPITITALIKQRERWARGCIYSLRRLHLLTNPRFNIHLKISYFACRLYWQSFSGRLIYIFSPLLFVIFHIPVVVCTLKDLILIWLPTYLLYMFTLRKISGDIRNTRWSNIVDTIMFPYLIIPIWMEIFGIRKREFVVTSKSLSNIDETPRYMMVPHLLLFLFSLYGLILAVIDLLTYHSLGTLVVIYWILQNTFNLLMAVFFMRGRSNERKSERLDVDLPVKVEFSHGCYDGHIVDISEGGFAFTLPEAVYLPYDKEHDATYTITDRDYRAVVKGRIATVKELHGRGAKWKYCVSLGEMDEENRAEYSQIIYDREHTLPKTLSSRSNYIGDLMMNLDARISPKKVVSARHVPRVFANEETTAADGTRIRICDFNFEYMRLEFPDLINEEKHTRREDLPQEVVLYSGKAYEMRCVPSGFNQYVYKIANFEELEESNAWKPKIEEWESKRAKKRGRRAKA